MTYRNQVWVSLLTSLLIFTLLYFTIKPHERTILNILSLIGFILSILGLVIAFIQISSVKAISLATQKEVQDSIAINSKLFLISDLASKVEIIKEIQRYLRDDKIELCILRMQDLKSSLNTIKNLSHYSQLTNKKEFNATYGLFNSDLNSFQIHAVNVDKKVDKEIILKNLEALSTVIQSVEIKLKN